MSPTSVFNLSWCILLDNWYKMSVLNAYEMQSENEKKSMKEAERKQWRGYFCVTSQAKKMLWIVYLLCSESHNSLNLRPGKLFYSLSCNLL